MHGLAIPGLVGLSISLAFGVLFISLLISAYFLFIGAKLAGIRDPTLGKAFVAMIGGGVVFVVIAAVFFFLPGINVLLALLAALWVVKVVFNTGWLRALLAGILAWVVSAVVFFLLKVLVVAVL
ncbi:hypothetical protein [Thermococcus sp. Bubb.Bath]|uniref:hypothetical protein n=1 Tax=Thermococcus sp. Bubb.Bath TaxID=1638242 RepID=UPI00143AF5A1|nr:hypothetical protein [Thermococcus sp. Bubb.Bath]NJF25971.1 hypothetical protein [Thermococcus sp. Bubb.Bath]